MFNILKADKAHMLALFYKAVPNNEVYNDVFYHGYGTSIHYHHILDWWELYIHNNVKCKVLRESLGEDIDDIVLYHLVERIADYLDTDIKYHKEEKKEEVESEDEEDFESILEKARANKK